MITTMYVPQTKLRQLQELVKHHDLRFLGNPIATGGRALVCLSSEHLPVGAANGFFADWDQLSRPIVEVKTSALTRVLRKLRGWCLGVLPT
jgi:hypothetical protein